MFDGPVRLGLTSHNHGQDPSVVTDGHLSSSRSRKTHDGDVDSATTILTLSPCVWHPGSGGGRACPDGCVAMRRKGAVVMVVVDSLTSTIFGTLHAPTNARTHAKKTHSRGWPTLACGSCMSSMSGGPVFIGDPLRSADGFCGPKKIDHAHYIPCHTYLTCSTVVSLRAAIPVVLTLHSCDSVLVVLPRLPTLTKLSFSQG
jgi:hypothetical protein